MSQLMALYYCTFIVSLDIQFSNNQLNERNMGLFTLLLFDSIFVFHIIRLTQPKIWVLNIC